MFSVPSLSRRTCAHFIPALDLHPAINNASDRPQQLDVTMSDGQNRGELDEPPVAIFHLIHQILADYIVAAIEFGASGDRDSSKGSGLFAARSSLGSFFRQFDSFGKRGAGATSLGPGTLSLSRPQPIIDENTTEALASSNDTQSSRKIALEKSEPIVQR